MAMTNERDKRQKTEALMRRTGTQVVLEKTDRILGVPDIRVQVKHSQIGAPAYTDGKTITINTNFEPMMSGIKNGFDAKTVMMTTGLNYHELAHCLFTPRVDSPLANRVRHAGAFMAFNALEDQLAETRFVSLYTPARHYFTALISQYMLNSMAGISEDELLAFNYPLVAGRLFLPHGMRKRFREGFHSPSVLDKIDDLVAEYKTLIYPHDEGRMHDVIIEFDRILKQTNSNTQVPTPHDDLQQGDVDVDRAEEAVAAGEYEDQETEEEEAEGEEEGSAGDEGDDDQESQGSSAGDEEEGEAEGEDQEGDQPSGESTSNQPGEVENAEPTEEDWKQDLEDMLNNALDEEIEGMEEELQDRIEAIREEGRNYQVQGDESGHSILPPTPEYHQIVARCADEFRTIELQHSPGWMLDQRRGKLDPRKYVKALRGDEHVFKKWREGVHDALDFEVVFLVDQSGSMMYTKIEEASVALWILQRTFDDCDGTTTVLGFSEPDELQLLSQRNTRAKRDQIPKYPTIGSTFIGAAVEEAARILSISQRKIKFCVIVSDGGFNDPGSVAQAMKENPDLLIAFVGIQQDVSEWNQHKNTLHAKTIGSPMELVSVVQGLALGLSQDSIKEYAR